MRWASVSNSAQQSARTPNLGPLVAVDGEIMPNADFVEVGSDTEVHFLPAIGGGTRRDA